MPNPGKKLLIVDDDPQFVADMTPAFRAADMAFATACDSRQALEIYMDDPAIDIALINVYLHEESGIDLLGQLRQTSPQRGVLGIMLTTGMNIESVVRSLRMRATDFLEKPVNPDHVVRIIRSLREERRAEDRRSRQPLGSMEEIALLKIAINAASNRHVVARDMAEGAWLILIEAAVYHMQEQPLFVTSACIASGAPISSAVRYINDLEENGYLRRMPDPADGRRTSIVITERGLELVESYTRRLRKRLDQLEPKVSAAS